MGIHSQRTENSIVIPPSLECLCSVQKCDFLIKTIISQCVPFWDQEKEDGFQLVLLLAINYSDRSTIV
jgi:hypothetical protein